MTNCSRLARSWVSSAIIVQNLAFLTSLTMSSLIIFPAHAISSYCIVLLTKEALCLQDTRWSFKFVSPPRILNRSNALKFPSLCWGPSPVESTDPSSRCPLSAIFCLAHVRRVSMMGTSADLFLSISFCLSMLIIDQTSFSHPGVARLKNSVYLMTHVL